MKHLLEISNIVSWKKVKKIEIFDEASLKNKSSKLNEFFEALMDGKFKTDRDAAALLYQSSPTDDKYRQLKSRFRKRLLNTLFFIDINLPSASNYTRAYFSCNKDWTLAKILLSYGAELTAHDIAGQILTIALKFKFADIIVNSARILRQNAAHNRDEKEFQYYNQIINEYRDIILAEMRSEEINQFVRLRYENTSTHSESKNNELDDQCDQLILLSEKYDSPVITFNMFYAWLVKFEYENDFHAVIEICIKMEDYITHNPQYEQDDMLLTFQIKKLNAFLNLRDFENAKKDVEKFVKVFEEGSAHWHKYMDLYFLTAMHSDNFANALAIHSKVTSSPKFRKAHRMLKEKWKIYEYYLYFMIENTQNNLQGIYKQKSTQLFESLMADPLIFAKEYRSYTVQSVIAKTLVAYSNKNFLISAENVERLKSYTTRPTRPEENLRVNLFIKLLVQLVKSNFNTRFLSGYEKHLDNLANTPMKEHGQDFDLEIYPYEKLWKLLVSKLN